MAAGVVVIWSGHAPRLEVLELPIEGRLVIGRELVNSGDHVSRRHCELSRRPHGLQVTDLGSRTGTFVEGDRVGPGGRTFEPPALIQIGETLLLAVDDVTPYAGRSRVTRYGLDVAVSLHAVCDQLAQAILDETNIAIAGPRWVTHQLGAAYLEARGGGTVVDVASRTRTLESTLAAGRARTVLIESPNALVKPELRTLETWLETDVRFVTCMRRPRDLDLVPHEIRRWLAPITLTIPEPRYDELPAVMHAAAAYAAPDVAIHVSAVLELLLHARDRTEDELFSHLSNLLRHAAARGDSKLSGGGLARSPRKGPTTFRMASYPVDDDKS
jgi:hypothetical protein